MVQWFVIMIAAAIIAPAKIIETCLMSWTVLLRSSLIGPPGFVCVSLVLRSIGIDLSFRYILWIAFRLRPARSAVGASSAA